MILITADVGGSKTRVAVTEDDRELIRVTGPGAGLRPGRALGSAMAIAELMRSALAEIGRMHADAIVVGAAGAGRAAEAEEARMMLARERIADRVIVIGDVALAFAALGVEVGAVLVAGTGSVATGRTPDGRQIRQGGLGWQMGDDGGGYWIGREALRAIGRAYDGRGPATTLVDALILAIGGEEARDVVGWSTTASPREVAGLSRDVFAQAAGGDPVANDILDRAARSLVELLEAMAPHFGGIEAPVGLTGGLLGSEGALLGRVRALVPKPLRPLDAPLDPLLGGRRVIATTGT